jgi:hypothetical protein
MKRALDFQSRAGLTFGLQDPLKDDYQSNDCENGPDDAHEHASFLCWLRGVFPRTRATKHAAYADAYVAYPGE